MLLTCRNFYSRGERTYRMLAVHLFGLLPFLVGSVRAFICLTTFRKRLEPGELCNLSGGLAG